VLKITKLLLVRRFFLFLALFFTVAIALGSLLSIDGEPLPQVQFLDKIVHAIGYGVLAESWLLAYKHLIKRQVTIFWIGLSVFIYGIVIEVLQGTLTSNRQADIYDLLANFVGILTAIIFFNIFFREKRVN